MLPPLTLPNIPLFRRLWPGAQRLGLATLLLLALLFTEKTPAATVATERKVLHGSLASIPAETAATMRPLAKQHLAESMDVEIALRMRDYPGLVARIGQSGAVPHDELERDHLPMKADYAALVQWLAAEGLTVYRTDPNRLAVFVHGTVAQLQRSFAVDMTRVTVDGADYTAAKTNPSLPAQIAGPILGINGLQPYLRPHRHLKILPAIGNAPPYLVSEILGAYNATNLGVTGAGQKIAILIDTTPTSTDLTSFWTNNNIPQSLSNVTTINVNNVTLPAPSGEETLDVEWSSGIASGAQIRVYAAGSLAFTALDVGLQQIISDLPSQPAMRVLSISLGLGETYITPASQIQTDSQYFATLASSGVTVFVSSGDGGATPNSTGVNTGPLQVEYYASDPSVTGVGGTSLTLNTTTGAVTSETAWSDSGGGASSVFSRPSWQTGPGVPSGTQRLVPDVCLAAAPGTGAYLFLNGSAEQIGGTSWSTPSWAGFCALMNQARANASKTPLGFLNSSLYPLIGTSNFRDITSGNNIGTNGGYSASSGFDEVTGIGSPNVGVLLQTLTAQGPGLTGFSPFSGPNGTTVTITGTSLAQVTNVQFSGVNAFFTINSSTQITTIVPASATTGLITLTSPLGGAFSATNFTVTQISVPNDNFANAQVISGSSGSLNSSTAGATKQTGEPNHAGNVGGASVWYSWTAPSSGIYTFDTAGSSFNTLLAVYTGTSVSNLTPVIANDDAGAVTTSAVSFAATGGTVYTIAVDGFDGVIGNFTLDWAANGSTTAITSFVPNSGNVGTTVTLNGANFSGATAVSFNGTSASFNVLSPTKLTAVVPPGAQSGAINLTAPGGTAASSTAFTVTTTPTNDNFAAAASFPGNFGVVTGSNIGATAESGEPEHAGIPGGKSVWWSWTPTASGQYSISTAGSNFKTLLAVYTGGSASALTAIASDGNDQSGGTSLVTFNATAGVTYDIAVDGAFGVSGGIVLTINPNSIVTTIYSTGFEASEGYTLTGTLTGQLGWTSSGSGGNGFLSSVFPTTGEQAFIGNTAPNHGISSLSLWHPVSFTPSPGDVVNFSVLTDIVDSTNSHYDDFQWDVYNIAGTRLFSFQINNQTNAISYILDDGTGAHATSPTLVNGHVYTLQISIDLLHNLWNATLDGSLIVSNEPATTVGSTLNLGGVRGSWDLNSVSRPGNNYMVFDNYNLSKTGYILPAFGTPPQSQTVIVGNPVTFTTAAFGTPTISYQWRMNGNPISNATSPSFTIPSVQASDAGNYDVVATNPAGSTTSSAVALTVETVDAISVAAAPSNEGTVGGGGSYISGSNALVTASPATGYAFANWTVNGSVVSTSANYSFTVTAPESLVANFQPATFSNWISTHYLAPQLTDPSITGPLADPNHNGIPNLLEYAFNLDPTSGNTLGLPAVSMPNGVLTITYRRNDGASDLTYVVQVSSDLATWNFGPTYTSSPVTVTDDGATQTDQVQVLNSANRFVRIQVTGP